jgi:glucoamylase
LVFLPQFHDSKRGYIISVVNQTDGWTHKTSNLDAAVILATIHGHFDLEYMRSSYVMIHATALELERVFKEIYPINKQNTLAVAIGRYPEDVYDGFGFSGGNPWFLTTHAFAEYYCRLAQANPSQREFLRSRGLDFLQRTLDHRNQETGEMSEQLDRRNGYLTGVSHLTWSYASFITAALTCGLGQ